jgi:hypothetical protein
LGYFKSTIAASIIVIGQVCPSTPSLQVVMFLACYVTDTLCQTPLNQHYSLARTPDVHPNGLESSQKKKSYPRCTGEHYMHSNDQKTLTAKLSKRPNNDKQHKIFQALPVTRSRFFPVGAASPWKLCHMSCTSACLMDRSQIQKNGCVTHGWLNS